MKDLLTILAASALFLLAVRLEGVSGSDIKSFELSQEQERYLEMLGESYYLNQRKERIYGPHKKKGSDFYYGANFPCVRGTIPIGNDGSGSILDGHKFVCGLHRIPTSPVIYSFGSHKQIDFEMAVLKLRPDASILVFELEKENMPDIEKTKSLSFHNIGLGARENGTDSKYRFESLQALMKMNKHEYIDILKMDIEGMEWLWLQKESHMLKRVGQLIVEIHTVKMCHSQPDLCIHSKKFMHPNIGSFVEQVEEFGMRVFHNEINLYAPESVSEVALIQKSISKWDQEKLHFLPLAD